MSLKERMDFPRILAVDCFFPIDELGLFPTKCQFTFEMRKNAKRLAHAMSEHSDIKCL